MPVQALEGGGHNLSMSKLRTKKATLNSSLEFRFIAITYIDCEDRLPIDLLIFVTNLYSNLNMFY